MAHPKHHYSAHQPFHEKGVATPIQNYQPESYFQQHQPGQGLIPIEDQDLRGILFVLAGLAGPAAFLLAARTIGTPVNSRWCDGGGAMCFWRPRIRSTK